MQDAPKQPMNFAGLAVAMTMGALGIVGINLYSDRTFVEESLLKRARAHHHDIVLARRWNAGYGGVYVEKKPGIESNPYLKNPDITTTDGRVLTLRIPAVMTRELSEMAGDKGVYQSHITSLKLKNPKNLADEWEFDALQRFEKGEKEIFARVPDATTGGTRFRYMAPLFIEESCLKCHEDMGYKVGDVRGGISVSFDVSDTESVFQDNAIATGVAMALILLGVGQLMFLSLRRVRSAGREAESQRQRFEALVQSTDGLVWEADAQTFRFTFVSEKAEEILGYPVSDWYAPGFWKDHLHPDDKAWAADYCASCTGRLEAHDFEYRFIARDGRTVWLHDLVSVVQEDGRPVLLRGLMIDITRRKANEALTEKINAEQVAILNNALVGIVYLRQRVIVSCNPRFEELFGYGPGELIGLSTQVLYSTQETFEVTGAEAYPAIARGEHYSQEVLLRHKDRRVFWGAITGQAIDRSKPHDGSIWIYADITERKHAEEEAGKLLRAVEQSPVSIVITGQDGLIEYVNPRFSQVTGYSRREATGQNPRILQSGETPAETYIEMWQTILSGKEWRGLLRNRRKNGELFWEEASIAPIVNEQGETTHFIAVKEDITERMQVERELEKYRNNLEDEVRLRTADLVLAMQKATAADRAKSEFLTNMSHEMRTPLNAVIGFCGLTQRTDLTEKQRDYLNKIEGASQHLLELIGNLLDLSKIAAGRVEVVESQFNPHELLARLSSTFCQKAAEKGLEINFAIPRDVPASLIGDALRLNQVLLNLLANAIKFTEQGRIDLAIRCGGRENGRVRLNFVVSDTGIGMDAVQLKRAFEPFAQGDASITRKYGGTGLGLAISRELVNLMGGQLEVSSEPFKGSQFEFSLDFGFAEHGAKANSAHDSNQDQALPFNYRFDQVRILVAEDQPMNRQVVEELLLATGVAVEMVTNGREAVDCLVERGPLAFDLVLMDLQMPELDGLSAMRMIRARPEFKNLPMVALTAHVLEEERLRAAAAGANDHLGKPFRPDDLYATVARWVAPHKVRRETKPSRPESDTPAGEAARLFGDATPVLDWLGGLERFDNRLDRYVGWLDRFSKERRSVVTDLEQTIARGDLAVASHEAHSLKGLSGTLGMTRVFQAARELEQALKSANPEAIREGQLALHEAFSEALNRVEKIQDAWQRRTAETGSVEPVLAPVDIHAAQDLIEALDRLQRMLQRGDGAASEWSGECLVRMRGHALEPSMRVVREAVEYFDFELAASRLVTLQHTLNVTSGAPK